MNYTEVDGIDKKIYELIEAFRLSVTKLMELNKGLHKVKDSVYLA